MTSRPDEPLNCGEICGELVYLLNLRAPVYINSEINSRVANIMLNNFPHGKKKCLKRKPFDIQTFHFNSNFSTFAILSASVTC